MEKPRFSKGNKAIAAALNKLADYAEWKGVNTAGRRGWSQTPTGKAPPEIAAVASIAPDGWDLVVAGNDSDPVEWTLYNPRAMYPSRSDVTDSVTINNATFVPEKDRWIIASMVAPIDDFLTAPEITIEMVEESDWTEYPAAHQFDASEPYAWIETRIPIWKLIGEADKTEFTPFIQDGPDGDPVYAERLLPSFPALIYTLEFVPSQNVLRSVPDLR